MKRFDMREIGGKIRVRYYALLGPLESVLTRLNIHPDVLTFAGLILSAVAGLLVGGGSFFWGAWVIVLAGVLDTLDGSLARSTGRASKFGAFFDSTLDRYGEAFILIGFAWFFVGGSAAGSGVDAPDGSTVAPWTILWILLAMVGSFMVSYTRARAEGLGLECKEGWFQRPQRMVLLVIGGLLGALPVAGPYILKCILFLLACLSNVTAAQRILLVRKALSSKESLVP